MERTRKEFYFESLGFQNRIMPSLIAGLACLIFFGLGACASEQGLRSVQGPEVILLVETESGGAQSLRSIGEALRSRMQAEGRNVILYPPRASHSFYQGPGVGPEDVGSRLQRAWDAYFQLDFPGALQRTAERIQGTRPGSTEWTQAQILAALIRYGEGRVREAKRGLSEVRDYWPHLHLTTDAFPPSFVTLYERSAKAVAWSPLQFHRDSPLKELQPQVRRLARQHHWGPIWLLRVVSIGWTERIDLQALGPGGRGIREYRQAEIGKNSTPNKVAKALWRHDI